MLNMGQVTACVNYALSVLLGAEGGALLRSGHLAYGAPEDDLGGSRALTVVPSGFFGQSYLTPESLPHLPLFEIEGVPLLCGKPLVQRNGRALVVHADIIASTFFLVTRYEEVIRRDVRDEHGRFPGRESLPYRAGFIDRPIVEEYAALLRKWLTEVGVPVPEPKRQSSVLLTHDVDRLRKYTRRLHPLRTTASALLGHRPLRDIPESVGVWLGLWNDPFDNLDVPIQLDAGLGANAAPVGTESTYFFTAGGRSPFDGAYDVRSPLARKSLQKVLASGATVGLHTSYEAGMRPELIAAEKARLEETCGFPIRRNRHHYLAWREIADGWALAKAGINWDSSLGYADVAGFRLGVCHPIPLFDPIAIDLMGIEEHPLLIMDCTIHYPKYMALDEPHALALCQHLITQTRKYNGECVMLWHNTEFAGNPHNYHPRLYRTLLARLAGR